MSDGAYARSASNPNSTSIAQSAGNAAKQSIAKSEEAKRSSSNQNQAQIASAASNTAKQSAAGNAGNATEPTMAEFDVKVGYGTTTGPAYGKGLYAEASGLEFRNGINIVNAEAGVSEIGGEYKYGEWNMNALTADAALSVDNEFVGIKAGARLISAGGEVKIPVPFTDKHVAVGLEGELFGISAQAGYDHENNRFKIGAALGVGGSVIFGID
jgi:hypothetical protein